MFSIYCKECGDEIAQTEHENIADTAKDKIYCTDCAEHIANPLEDDDDDDDILLEDDAEPAEGEESA